MQVQLSDIVSDRNKASGSGVLIMLTIHIMSMMGLHTFADAGIGNEAQSVLAAVDDQLRPTPESQDIMSDQGQSEGDIQQAPMEITNDVEVITKDEFDNLQLTQERKIIRDIRSNSKRLMKTVKKQKETVEELQTQQDIEEDNSTTLEPNWKIFSGLCRSLRMHYRSPKTSWQLRTESCGKRT